MTHYSKELKKGAKEVFHAMTEDASYVFEGPDYIGLSDNVFKALDQNALDALVAGFVIAQERRKNKQAMDANDFAALCADQYDTMFPEEHEKADKPGKKHDRKQRYG